MSEDTIEALSLPDVHDLIRETAETLDALVDHVSVLRQAATGDDLLVVELHAVADFLAQSWALARRAQTTAQELAAARS